MTPSRPSTVEAALLVCVLGLAGCTTLTPEGRTAALISRAETAMGSTTLKTLTVTGRGSGASVGQAYAPGMAWPGLQLTALSRSLNFVEQSFREEYIRSRSEPLGGGTTPPMGAGDERGVVLAREASAWDVVGVATVAAPAALAERLHDLWTSTPQGAIKAAAQFGARAGVRRDVLRRWDTLSFSMPGHFSATLVLEDNGLVSRIESKVANPVFGEMPVLTRFLDYRPQAGQMMPSRIMQDQGGFASLDLRLTAVAANEPVEITIPDNVQSATETVSVERVAPGVWLLAGGTHHSVAIEQAQQLLLVELPLHPARAQAVLDRANKLVSGKKVMTVINTHHHVDAAGGLSLAVADGIPVFTSAVARPSLEAAFVRPLAVSPISPVSPVSAPAGTTAFVAVEASTLLSDSERPVEIHTLQDPVHALGLLVVWLPRERLLIEADAYTPAAPNAPPLALPNASHVNLVQNLDRLGLAPRLIVPLRGRVVPAADLYTQVGRKPPR